jgi:hypothetical protein
MSVNIFIIPIPQALPAILVFTGSCFRATRARGTLWWSVASDDVYMLVEMAYSLD